MPASMSNRDSSMRKKPADSGQEKVETENENDSPVDVSVSRRRGLTDVDRTDEYRQLGTGFFVCKWRHECAISRASSHNAGGAR